MTLTLLILSVLQENQLVGSVSLSHLLTIIVLLGVEKGIETVVCL